MPDDRPDSRWVDRYSIETLRKIRRNLEVQTHSREWGVQTFARRRLKSVEARIAQLEAY